MGIEIYLHRLMKHLKTEKGKIALNSPPLEGWREAPGWLGGQPRRTGVCITVILTLLLSLFIFSPLAHGGNIRNEKTVPLMERGKPVILP
jgi:hypothetical protein